MEDEAKDTQERFTFPKTITYLETVTSKQDLVQKLSRKVLEEEGLVEDTSIGIWYEVVKPRSVTSNSVNDSIHYLHAFCVFCTSHLIYARNVDFESDYKLAKLCRYHSHVPQKSNHGKSKLNPKALDISNALNRGKMNNILNQRQNISHLQTSPMDLLNGIEFGFR